ncbi:hypothetical protein HanIR_Chr07g0316701 [Helianthus annuus]|nr:hypothetical protein HanIR_Chr07g0316701 [Helianthus annuus]
MRIKPHINTSDVESVSALRQHTDLVSVCVLRQTDRTICKRLSCAFTSVVVFVIYEFRESLEDFFLDSFVSRREVRVTASVGGSAAEPGAASDGEEAEDAD